jgi:hypothetical protein
MRDTIDMAREAGDDWDSTLSTDKEFLKRFEALVRADEREACAKVCEELVPDMSRTANDASVWDVSTFDCATAIRGRVTNDL